MFLGLQIYEKTLEYMDCSDNDEYIVHTIPDIFAPASAMRVLKYQAVITVIPIARIIAIRKMRAQAPNSTRSPLCRVWYLLTCR